MSRKRKEFKHGERLSIYIKKDISEEMLDWINNQSDITSFFLYAALQLYKETGNVDLATIIPMKIDFSLEGKENQRAIVQNNNKNHIVDNLSEKESKVTSESISKEKKEWSNLDLSQDPYA